MGYQHRVHGESQPSPSSGQITVTEQSTSTSSSLKMSLWKVMTMPMSQVGKFVWGKEGFKWISDAKQGSGGHTGAAPGSQHQSFSSSSYDGAAAANQAL